MFLFWAVSYEILLLSQERTVRPAPYAIPAYIGVGAGNTLTASSVGSLAIGEYRISRIELCKLMILIPHRLRSQSKISTVAGAASPKRYGELII